MHTPHTFSELFDQIRVRIVPFLVVFFAIIFITYLVLYVIDIYPEPKTEESTDSTAVEIIDEVEPEIAEVTKNVSAEPLSIIFDSLDREVKVLNPSSSDVADLDEALLSGVVRHPDSADFTDPGNIFILGHSSYLPNVLNKNYQAFNGVEDLQWGDTIRLQSADMEYVYRVDRVYKAKASEVVVPTNITESKLTLATCNVFGAKEDRFMVEATLISENTL